MNLAIDIGNTALKIGVFDRGTLVFNESCKPGEAYSLLNRLSDYAIQASIISSVAPVPELFTNYLTTISFNLNLDESTSLPFRNHYETPKTLGTDRLANVAGACILYPGKHVVVIDVGTCLKIDWIDNTCTYRGGSISPGLMMRYKALHTFTDRLPLLDPVDSSELTGKNTLNSIHSGVLNGMIGEIDSMIGNYKQKLNEVQFILTGGDTRYFLNTLKTRIFAIPTLNLQGLDSILRFNQ